MRRMFLMDKPQETEPELVFDVWDGTVGTFPPPIDSDNWYVVSTAAQLAGIASYINTNGSAWADEDFKVRLDANLDLNNLPWTPIGLGIDTFLGDNYRGIFDGCGHTIKNLNVITSLNGTNLPFVGLFGVIQGDSPEFNRISGLIVKSTSVINATYNVGGIIAGAINANIYNCINYCGVLSNTSCAGGIVGLIANIDETHQKDVNVVNCINFGNISVDLRTSSTTGGGGIVGTIYSTTSTGNINIKNCVNYGTVGGMVPITNLSAGVSGILGGPLYTPSDTTKKCTFSYCANAGTFVPNMANDVFTPIAKVSYTDVEHCYYWAGPATGIGTQITSASECPICAIELSNDLFKPEVNQKIKPVLYPPESTNLNTYNSVGVNLNNPALPVPFVTINNKKEGTFNGIGATNDNIGNTNSISYTSEEYDPTHTNYPYFKVPIFFIDNLLWTKSGDYNYNLTGVPITKVVSEIKASNMEVHIIDGGILNFVTTATGSNNVSMIKIPMPVVWSYEDAYSIHVGVSSASGCYVYILTAPGGQLERQTVLGSEGATFNSGPYRGAAYIGISTEGNTEIVTITFNRAQTFVSYTPPPN